MPFYAAVYNEDGTAGRHEPNVVDNYVKCPTLEQAVPEIKLKDPLLISSEDFYYAFDYGRELITVRSEFFPGARQNKYIRDEQRWSWSFDGFKDKVVTIDIQSPLKIKYAANLFGDFPNLRYIFGIGRLDISEAKDWSYMFKDFKGETLDISGFQNTKAEKAHYMFYNCKNLKTIYSDYLNWDRDSFDERTAIGMFIGCKSL